MSEVPISQEPLDVVDDSYKRASALDSSKPSEFARRKVLAHAAQVAAERAVKHGASAQAPRFNAPPPATKSPSRAIIIGGAVVAVAVAGFLIVPPLLAPPPKPLTAPPPVLAGYNDASGSSSTRAERRHGRPDPIIGTSLAAADSGHDAAVRTRVTRAGLNSTALGRAAAAGTNIRSGLARHDVTCRVLTHTCS